MPSIIGKNAVVFNFTIEAYIKASHERLALISNQHRENELAINWPRYDSGSDHAGREHHLHNVE